MRIPTGVAIEELPSGPRGGLREPGDLKYTERCTHFNAMFEHRPQLVAPLFGRGRCDRLLGLPREAGSRWLGEPAGMW